MLESFFRGDYMPHGHCYLWQPHILLTHVVSDALIALAYFSIPFGIMLFVKGRDDIKDNSVFILFSLFIVFCGISHLFGIWTIWQGVYGLHGISKVATATVSVLTAIYVFKNLPVALKLPSTAQFQGVVRELNVQSDQNLALLSQLEAQRLARVMLDALPVSALLLDEKGAVKLANQSVEREFSVNKDRLHSGMITDFFIPLSADIVRHVSQFSQSDEQSPSSLSFLGDIESSDGSLIPAEISLTKIDYAESRLVVATIKNLSDVTQIKQALEESHLQFERATNVTKDGIFEFDLAKGTSTWSDTLHKLLGTPSGSSPSYNTLIEHVHPEYRNKVQSAIDEHWLTKLAFDLEYVGRTASGQFGWFQIRGNSTFSQSGEPHILSGSIRYIQAQKETERSERQKSNFLSAIYEGANQAIWAAECLPDNEFRFVEYNATALKRSGDKVTLDMIVNKTLTDISDVIFPAPLIERIRSNYARCAQLGTTIKYVEQLEIDQEHWYQTSLYPVFNDEGKVTHVIGSAIDISEQKRTELALDEQNNFLESILNNSVCGLYIYDFEQGTNIQINARYNEMLGYTLSDLAEVDDFLSLFHPDDHQKVTQHMRAITSSSADALVPLEYRFKHKDGRWIWCYSYDSVIKRDSEGKACQMLGTFIDVTEKNQLLAQLSESNAYLERFAFVASHDLQEPLRKISAFSESLLTSLHDKLNTDDERYELTRIHEAAGRMRLMIKGLLSLSRINTTALNIEPHSLQALVSESLADLSLLVNESNATIDVDIGDITLLVDGPLFKQVTQNLIQNAIKFVKNGSNPCLKITAEEHIKHIKIEFSDNGIGIEPQFTTTIFEPFRRLHRRDEYSGSGIGLALVKQIIKVHGGDIECKSRAGEGAVFVITLPRS